ncbi:uncharacterized protein MKK02DRAFT_23978 [Dioszegia hungarica]|uniref:Uncharacterized protein n=1 Tax=Dioszegia hungarica TaxID=4972 RepID=A0AA38HBT9_9TREE|nr:uncharacterized protein MKK02DRAFT_23978 [Dioszegia hungarica]KAI9637267.1 hypothetical protein MKK02DRAFT_23978 [Dioszegia hungarica]
MDPQTHLIYLLLDSNLPTGGFVASSGLESWAKHGLGGPYSAYTSTSAAPVSGTSHGAGQAGSQPSRAGGQVHASKRVTEFMEAEVDNYAMSTGWFVRQGWRVVEGRRDSGSAETATTADDIEQTLQSILALDKTHEATLLSHVSRRASKAQGVAILTLYTKGLTRPPGYATSTGDIPSDTNEEDKETSEEREGREEIAGAVVEGYKRLIRRGLAPGHLAVCWGLMMAALGLSLEKGYHLYLFLHARSVLSAAVRLNLIGPYLSSQLLLHPTNGILARHEVIPSEVEDEWSGGRGDFWDWAIEAEKGPATTWPLGEVLVARHDLQHSRIFNS